MLKVSKYLFYILFLLALINNGYTFNRWFKVSPGFRIAGLVVDMSSRVPSNGTTTRLDFGFGMNLDIQLEKYIGVDVDLLYIRKGASMNSGGSTITLQYLSIPTLAKFYITRKKWAVVIGPVHNFLLGADGTLASPNVPLNSSNTNVYELGFAFGMSYVIKTYSNGMRLVGDLRFEIGLTNVFKDFRPELFNRTAPYLAIGLNF